MVIYEDREYKNRCEQIVMKKAAYAPSFLNGSVWLGHAVPLTVIY